MSPIGGAVSEQASTAALEDRGQPRKVKTVAPEQPRLNAGEVAAAVRVVERFMKLRPRDPEAVAVHELLRGLQHRAWRQFRYGLAPIEAAAIAQGAVNRAFADLDPAQRSEALMRLLHALTDDEAAGHA
jgi:hypothetical protein